MWSSINSNITQFYNSLDLKILKFEIQGQSYKEICGSGQCKIDYSDQYTYFHRPSPEFMAISTNNDFILQDNATNADVGPKKKEFLEQFTVSMFCNVDNIIEENGQEVHTCHDGSGSIIRKFDQKNWDYYSIAIYDVKNNTLKVFGSQRENPPTSQLRASILTNRRINNYLSVQ